ncbi:MAG TPA: hypothetical protein VIL35_12920 [Vicinamibacterales bacterium]
MARAHALIDHDEIRQWAEARGASPACVKGTGGRGDTGMIRLDFPGYSGGESLQRISWDDWFSQFDDNGLALLVQDRTAAGEPSNFNKLVSRASVAGGGTERAADEDDDEENDEEEEDEEEEDEDEEEEEDELDDEDLDDDDEGFDDEEDEDEDDEDEDDEA